MATFYHKAIKCANIYVVLLMGLPVAFGLLLVGIVGSWVLVGPPKTLSLLGIVPHDRISNYPLSLIPPSILAAIVSLGYDPIWFGIVIVVLCELALITPPSHDSITGLFR